MSNLNKHILSDKVKWIICVAAFVLVAVFLAAACTQGFTNANPWGWFDEKEEKNTAEAVLMSEECTREAGIVLSETHYYF